MTNWTETYRGAVPPWQCDVTEHFTIAYYFDRVEEAEANLADELGLGDLSRHGDLPRRLDARFVRELRAGSSFHVESAALSVENGLRIGHRFVEFDQRRGRDLVRRTLGPSAAPLTPQQRGAIEAAARGLERSGGRTAARAGRDRRFHRHRARTGQAQ